MSLIRFFLAAHRRKTDRLILRVLRRRPHHDAFALELERRLLGQ
jgi:hypothetical protein